MTRHYWTPDELELLAQRYPDTLTRDVAEQLGLSVRSIYAKANSLGIRKTQAFFASPEAKRLDGIKGGATRFGKVPPWNKGMKGLQIGGKETQFKPGHRGGAALAKYKPIGTERISKDGYLQRKVNDDMPLQGRWKAVHTILWEEANGPVPRGFALVFVNGDKRDIRLENLELISRRALMQRNTVHNYPAPVVEVIQLRGALKRKLNRLEKNDVRHD